MGRPAARSAASTAASSDALAETFACTKTSELNRTYILFHDRSLACPQQPMAHAQLGARTWVGVSSRIHWGTAWVAASLRSSPIYRGECKLVALSPRLHLGAIAPRSWPGARANCTGVMHGRELWDRSQIVESPYCRGSVAAWGHQGQIKGHNRSRRRSCGQRPRTSLHTASTWRALSTS